MRSTRSSLAPGLGKYITTPILAVLDEGRVGFAEVADWCVGTRGRRRGECVMTDAWNESAVALDRRDALNRLRSYTVTL